MSASFVASRASYADSSMNGEQVVIPDWDPVRRELRLGGVLVKRFRQPAKNQEMLLAAFQEEDWPPRIDDPLPGEDNRVGAERLRDTVKKLNRQKVQMIRFLCDGTGQGILWELVKVSGSRCNL